MKYILRITCESPGDCLGIVKYATNPAWSDSVAGAAQMDYSWCQDRATAIHDMVVWRKDILPVDGDEFLIELLMASL